MKSKKNQKKKMLATATTHKTSVPAPATATKKAETGHAQTGAHPEPAPLVGKNGKRVHVFGFSLCAVIRRLGKEGLKAKRVNAIMKAIKAPASDATISQETPVGALGKGKMADLSTVQLKTLLDAAPEEV